VRTRAKKRIAVVVVRNPQLPVVALVAVTLALAVALVAVTLALAVALVAHVDLALAVVRAVVAVVKAVVIPVVAVMVVMAVAASAAAVAEGGGGHVFLAANRPERTRTSLSQCCLAGLR
jgi:hypothetical protein